MKAVALLLACCAACSLGGKAPEYNYFVLTPGRAAAPETTPRERATVAISQVSIPGYLDRPSLVTRTSDHRLSYSARDRWAEPIDTAFERILEQDLADALAPHGISMPTRAGAPTYDVHVDVLRFERHGANRVELWARWTLRADARIVHTDETHLVVAVGPTSASVAAGLSEAIAGLANEIAAGIHTEVARGPRTPRQARR